MEPFGSVGAASSYLALALSEAATDSLKELLEVKHLYQSVEIPHDAIAEVATLFRNESYDSWLQGIYSRPTFGLANDLAIPKMFPPPLIIAVRSIKVYCPECGSAEAMNPIRTENLFNSLLDPTLAQQFRFATHALVSAQIFVLVYHCQRCRGIPQTFIVRQQNWKLSLHGRSPMEHIEVPNFIPKTEKHLYRDALIAFNTGKHLAALFYLRCFIEQFARRITGLVGRITGDEIMDKYNGTLDAKHKEHMPSLREWYDKLSEPIHSSRDDAKIFQQALEKINGHFDLRRAFKINNEPTVDTTISKSDVTEKV